MVWINWHDLKVQRDRKKNYTTVKSVITDYMREEKKTFQLKVICINVLQHACLILSFLCLFEKENVIKIKILLLKNHRFIYYEVHKVVNSVLLKLPLLTGLTEETRWLVLN